MCRKAKRINLDRAGIFLGKQGRYKNMSAVEVRTNPNSDTVSLTPVDDRGRQQTDCEMQLPLSCLDELITALEVVHHGEVENGG